ncbi:MAG: hypothetical protein GY774_15600 [Planctomycetes bacterium]|nr:hypothetical protein [Planctomycetota bacterium]
MTTKSLRLLACVGICLFLGCRESEEQVLDTSFCIIANKLIDQKDLFVQHITIEALGQRTIQVNAEGQLFRRGIVHPDQSTNILRYELVFVAALINRPDSSSMIKWFIQGKGPNATSYHPATFEVEANELSQVLRMDISNGLQPYNQKLVLGKLLKDQIELLVE